MQAYVSTAVKFFSHLPDPIKMYAPALPGSLIVFKILPVTFGSNMPVFFHLKTKTF